MPKGPKFKKGFTWRHHFDEWWDRRPQEWKVRLFVFAALGVVAVVAIFFFWLHRWTDRQEIITEAKRIHQSRIEALDLSLEIGNGFGRFLIHRPSGRRRQESQPEPHPGQEKPGTLPSCSLPIHRVIHNTKRQEIRRGWELWMGLRGLEPPWVTPTDPKSVASASFATGPWFLL